MFAAPLIQPASLSGEIVTRSELKDFLGSIHHLSLVSIALSSLVFVLIVSFIFFSSRRQRRTLQSRDQELQNSKKEIAYQQEILRKNTELEERLKELTRARDYNENLLKSMNSGVVVINFECFVITFNKAAEEILGLGKQEVIGSSIFDHTVFSGLYELLIDTLKTERSYIRHEIWVRNHEGNDVPLGVSTSVLKDRNDDSMGIIAIFRDLTEIKELERKVEQAKRLASLGEMAAGVAHEIRNPLNPIRGFAQMISEDLPPGDPKNKYTKIIIEQVDHLGKIVNDLLDFAKYVDLTIGSCDIWDVINETLQLLSEGAGLPPGIDVKLEGELSPPAIPADSNRLMQVFINLFRNGIESMAGEGILTIAVEVDEQMVSVIVKDTGPGIQAEDLGRLFNPFFTTKSGGTGLGLSITYGIIERHGGMISAVNQPDGGAVFTLSLPREEEQIAEVEL